MQYRAELSATAIELYAPEYINADNFSSQKSIFAFDTDGLTWQGTGDSHDLGMFHV
jgi:hypothetical protein